MAKKVLLLFLGFLLCSLGSLAEDKGWGEFSFVGTIDNKYKIHMELSLQNEKVEGIYYYDKERKKIILKGVIDNQGNIELFEYADNELTGKFIGKLINDKTIVGLWQSPDKKTVYPFNLEREAITDVIDYYVNNVAINSPYYTESTQLMMMKADFNHDGREDIAVSDTSEWSNNNGGLWYLFLNETDGFFYKICTLYFNPFAIQIQYIDKMTTMILICWHISVNEWNVQEYFLTKNRLKEGKLFKERNDSDNYFIEGEPLSQVERFTPDTYYCYLKDYLKDKNCQWIKYN